MSRLGPSETKRTYPAGGKVVIPAELRWKIWERDNFACHYCGSRSNLTVDHKTPEIHGGTLDPENLVTACKPCNQRKKTTPYDVFRRRREQEPGLVTKMCIGVPVEVQDALRSFAVARRQKIEAVATEALCRHLGIDPARFI